MKFRFSVIVLAMIALLSFACEGNKPAEKIGLAGYTKVTMTYENYERDIHHKDVVFDSVCVRSDDAITAYRRNIYGKLDSLVIIASIEESFYPKEIDVYYRYRGPYYTEPHEASAYYSYDSKKPQFPKRLKFSQRWRNEGRIAEYFHFTFE